MDCGLVTHEDRHAVTRSVLGAAREPLRYGAHFTVAEDEAPGVSKGPGGVQGACSESPEGALRTGWGCDRHTCTHTQTRMHTQTQTHTQTHKSVQTCAPSHPTHVGMHKAHPETHTSHTHTRTHSDIESTGKGTHTNTHASRYKHKNAGTQTHTHSGTNTQTHQCAHADAHGRKCTDTHTHPAQGRQGQPDGRCSTRCWPLSTAAFSLQLLQVLGHPAFKILLDFILEEGDPLSLKSQP